MKKYAASRAHVWSVCEPSETLARESKNPFKVSTPEQAEGVAIHEAIAAELVGGELGVTAQKIIDASDDAQSIIDFCVAAVCRLRDFHGGEVNCESVCDYEGDSLFISARPDAVIWNNQTKTLVVIDYKTGYVPVAAEGNEQLLIYAHAFVVKNKIAPTKIHGVIIQPRLTTIEYADIDYDSYFFDKLEQNLHSRQDIFRVGAHCKNCSALTICRLFRDTVVKYYEPSLKDGLSSRPDEWAKLIAIARPAKKFFDEILDEAKTFLELGGKIDGVGYTLSGGRRAWVREARPDDIAERIGVKEDDLYEPKKMKSPAQVEKILKKDKREKVEAMRAFIYQPQNSSINIVGDENFLSAKDGKEKFITVATAVSEILSAKRKNKNEKQKENHWLNKK